MTTERFTVDDGLEDVLCWEINDKENENMTCGECAKLLNELHEENKLLLRKNGAMEEEIECLSEENKELKKDEKQLGIDFMGYKMRLIEVLQKRYDKTKGQTLYADVYTEIAEEMGVDLE